ncbi:MAG: 2-oxo acid dehydrogenase subunit E2 [Actinobacteria bacterium]|nr:2-oxo acid dehydrogenase subunit E2 [Actinomycetota bacterium]
MVVPVVMPKLGLTMQEGTVTRWHVSSGTTVRAGSAAFDISTDKIETEIEIEGDGVLHHAVPEGAVVGCGQVVGWLCAEGEAPPVSVAPGSPEGREAVTAAVAPEVARVDAAPGNGAGRLRASPNARRIASELGVDLGSLTGTGPGGRIVSEDVEEAAAAGGAVAVPSGTRGLMTPVARRLASRLGIDPGAVAGSGPGGRVVLDDVIAAAGAAPGRASVRAEERAPVHTVVPMTGKRAIIADRMHASLRDMAQLTLTTDATVNRLVRLRRALREEWGEAAPGYTDFVLLAVARALRAHPQCNATIRDGAIHLIDAIHLGLAVALDDGLVVPVVRDADQRSLVELAAETARLAAAARAGKLNLDELEGATFSVTSLGAHGIDAFTPVVNPPNVAILGVGRIRDDVRWSRRNKPRRRRALTLSLTIDHRALDGVPAAEFLATVRSALESPHQLLLGA